MLELLKVMFKDEKRTVGHSMIVEAYLIDGDCNVGDVVLVNVEAGRNAKLVRVVTEVLPHDEFTMSYLVALDTMTDVYLADQIEVGTSFDVENGGWKGRVCVDESGKYIEVIDRNYRKLPKSVIRLSEDIPYALSAENLNREGYELYMLTVNGEKTHISEIKDRSVDVAMLDTMRMNSYVQNVLPEKLTTEALIERAVHLKSMCGYTSSLAATYEEAVVHVMVPELLVRLKELNDRVKELENRTNG